MGQRLVVVMAAVLVGIISALGVLRGRTRRSPADRRTGKGSREISLVRGIRRRYSPYVRWKHSLEQCLEEGSRVVPTPRGQVEYAIYGSSGPFVAIVHGGPGGYDQAEALFPGLLGQGFRILSWSRPGYLRTPLAAGRTFREQADLLLQLMDALHIESAAVLGYSAGGPPALEFAVRHSERLWALILECAVTRPYTPNPQNIREQLFGRILFNDPALWLSSVIAEHEPALVARSAVEMESSLREDEVRSLLRHIMHDPRREEIVLGMIRSMSPPHLRKKGLRNDLRRLAALEDIPMETIEAPALIIHGTDDFDVSIDHAEHAARRIPSSSFLIVREGFHIMSLSERKEEVDRARVSFLKRHAPRL